MHKYWEISKIYMKTQLAWRADVIFNMLFTITKILFAYLLWGIIFQNKDTVGGFTFYVILSYHIISSFLSQLEMSADISNEIRDRIRNGTFSKYMVIPVGIEKYFFAMELGMVFMIQLNYFLGLLTLKYQGKGTFLMIKDNLASMLLVGMCRDEALSGILIISLWCLLMQTAIHFTWEKYIRKYDGVGI